MAKNQFIFKIYFISQCGDKILFMYILHIITSDPYNELI